MSNNSGENLEAAKVFIVLVINSDKRIMNDTCSKNVRWDVESNDLVSDILIMGQFWTEEKRLHINDPSGLVKYWTDNKKNSFSPQIAKEAMGMLNFCYGLSSVDYALVNDEFFNDRNRCGITLKQDSLLSVVSIKTNYLPSILNNGFPLPVISKAHEIKNEAILHGESIAKALSLMYSKNERIDGGRINHVIDLLGEGSSILDISSVDIKNILIEPLMMHTNSINKNSPEIFSTENQKDNYAMNQLMKLSIKYRDRGSETLRFTVARLNEKREVSKKIQILPYKNTTLPCRADLSKEEQTLVLADIMLLGTYNSDGYHGLSAREVTFVSEDNLSGFLTLTDDKTDKNNLLKFRDLLDYVHVEQISRKHAYYSVNVIQMSNGEFRVLVTVPFNLRIHKLNESSYK